MFGLTQIGFPPFSSNDQDQTFKKIQNWQEHFYIPPDINISMAAVNLIEKLICNKRKDCGDS